MARLHCKARVFCHPEQGVRVDDVQIPAQSRNQLGPLSAWSLLNTTFALPKVEAPRQRTVCTCPGQMFQAPHDVD